MRHSVHLCLGALVLVALAGCAASTPTSLDVHQTNVAISSAGPTTTAAPAASPPTQAIITPTIATLPVVYFIDAFG